MSHFRRLLPLLGAGWPTLVSPGVLSPLASFSRAQVGSLSSAVLADGATRVEFGADVRRFSGAARRLLIEGQRTNSFANPRCEGAAPGTPGTVPTGWSVSNTVGVTVSVIGNGVEDGIEYVEFEITGTPSSSGVLQINQGSAVSASDGQSWTYSIFSRLSGGSLTNFGQCSIPLTIGTASVNGFYTIDSNRLGSTRRANTVVGAGGAANASGRWRVAVTSGLPVSGRFRLGAPQLELGAFASTPILPPVGTPAASTRGADLVSAPLASLGISDNGACTIVGTFMLPGFSNEAQTVIHIDGGSVNNRFTIYRTGTGTAFRLLRATLGVNVAAPDLGTTVVNVPHRFGLVLRGDGSAAAAFEAGAVQAVTGGPTTGMTTLRVGHGVGGTLSLAGEVGTLRLLPYAVSDAELQARVAALPL